MDFSPYVDLLANRTTEIFSILFLPSIIFGLAIGYAFFQIPSFGHKYGRLVFFTAAFLVTIPVLLLFTIFSDGSELIVLYQHALVSLIGVLFIAAAFQRVPSKDRLKQFGFVALGLVITAFFSWRLVGDFLFPRHQVDGVITAKYESSNSYNLTIYGRTYSATWLVFSKVSNGQLIRAEYGRGSRTIFHLYDESDDR